MLQDTNALSPKLGSIFSGDLNRIHARLVTVGLLLSCNIICPISCLANVSAADLVSAIETGKILTTGTRVSAAINGHEAYISTYRNIRATDNDCKIEAVLIAKAAMDMAPNDITRATIYFYSTANINKRKFVTVTAGDVKSFGSGQTGQEQLLSSLTVKDELVVDPAAKLAISLQQREAIRNKRSFETSMDGQTMVVVAETDPGISQRDLRYEAFKIAEKALNAEGGKADKVMISFTDPLSRGTVQQISLDSNQIKSIDSGLQSALTSIEIATIANRIDVQTLTTADGPEKEDRDKLLTGIKTLDKQGVGVTPFIRAFFDIEKMASSDNTAQLKPAISRLSTALNEQQARSKSAKDFKPVAGGDAAKVEQPATDTIPTQSSINGKKIKTSRWAGGSTAMTEGEILANPDAAIETQARSMGGIQKAEQNRNFGTILYHAYEVLNANNRTQDAQRILRRYNDLKAKNSW